MDIELETYVDGIIENQELRNGIFGSALDRWMAAIAFTAPVLTSAVQFTPKGG